jgi:serine/threonine protein kinase
MFGAEFMVPSSVFRGRITDSAMALASGQRIGVYEVIGPIGAGGMGEVYRARDTRLGRDVALKILPDVFAADPDRLARFEREAQVLASLNHPHIAAIHGFEESGSVRALVMELVEGDTLADRIATGALPLDDALAIAKQIADALEAAHDRGVVHRDLRPANIKITPAGVVKVLDFGLAKAIEAIGATPRDVSASPTITSPAMTNAGVIIGTAAYMSPEQAKGVAADQRSDIWAFGVVLFEMLTGQRAFSGDSVTETLAFVLTKEPEWKTLPSTTPAALRRLLRRCLTKDRRDRLAHASDVRLEIADAVRSPDESAVPREVRMSRPQRLMFATALIVALLAGALATFAAMRNRSVAAPEIAHLEITSPANATIISGSVPMLSPNGKLIAFPAVDLRDGVSRIWIRPVDSLEARSLTGTELTSDSFSVFWSPDNLQLAFATGAGGTLKKISINGGPAQTLCKLPTPQSILVGGSWNRDDVIIFGDVYGGLTRTSAIDGGCAALTRPQAMQGHLFPEFLPDGKHFVYIANAGIEDSTLVVGSLDAKPEEQQLKQVLRTPFKVRVVPSDETGGAYLLFVREGNLFAQAFDTTTFTLNGEALPVAEDIGTRFNLAYFSASSTGTLAYRSSASNRFQLTWFGRDGTGQTDVGDPILPTPWSLSVSGDGRRAFFQSFIDATPMLVDLVRGQMTAFGAPDSVGGGCVVWSADDSRVAFLASNVAEIHASRPSAFAEPERLGKLPESVPGATTCVSDWSRDGRLILYEHTSLKTRNDVFALPVEGGKAPFAVLNGPGAERDGRFSPNGRWIAFTSDESGRDESYVRAAGTSGGRPGRVEPTENIQISKGGVNPAVAWTLGWSDDGRQVWYVTTDLKVFAVDVTTERGLRPSDPRFLFQMPAGTMTGATDGERFLLAVPSKQSTQVPFRVILNWPELLRRRNER